MKPRVKGNNPGSRGCGQSPGVSSGSSGMLWGDENGYRGIEEENLEERNGEQ